MNETLRKRLVGAVVLVALGILVPFGLAQWLAMPKPTENGDVRVYEITPDGRAHPVPPDSEPSPPPREETPPTATTEPATEAWKPEPTPESAADSGAGEAVEAAPEPQSPAQPPAETADTSGASASWSAQVGSFRSEENARHLMDKLAADFPVFYNEGEVDGVTYYRVRVGPYSDETEARRAADALIERGRKAQVRRES